jgi:hypothetical protein
MTSRQGVSLPEEDLEMQSSGRSHSSCTCLESVRHFIKIDRRSHTRHKIPSSQENVQCTSGTCRSHTGTSGCLFLKSVTGRQQGGYEHTWFVPQDPVQTELGWDISTSSTTRLAAAPRTNGAR